MVTPEHSPDVPTFTAKLSPHTKGWRSLSSAWVFRGQASDSWRLVPSAFRPRDKWKAWLDTSSMWRRPETVGALVHLPAHAQAEWERKILEDFVSRADRSGLRIPEDSQLARRALARTFGPQSTDQGEWPPIELLSHLALAQHYGVPTRLLDWTYDVRTAMYFAASGGAPADQNLVVWALDANAIAELWGEPVSSAERFPYRDQYEAKPGEVTRYDSNNPRVEIVTAPYEAIPNLAAQRGLFTIDRALAVPHDDGAGGTITGIPLDEAIRKRIQRSERGTIGPPLWRFTLPRTEAPALLRWLAVEGISAATIWPGYRGVADSMIELR